MIISVSFNHFLLTSHLHPTQFTLLYDLQKDFIGTIILGVIYIAPLFFNAKTEIRTKLTENSRIQIIIAMFAVNSQIILNTQEICKFLEKLLIPEQEIIVPDNRLCILSVNM